MPTTQGVAPGYIILGLQPISTPIEEAMPWIKEEEKIIPRLVGEMTPSPFGHFPYDRGSFWVALKSSPVLGELPAGVRGFSHRSRLKA